MQIKRFLLDHWLDEHGGVPYDLACSTGPAWTMRDVFELMPPEEKESLWDARVTYRPAAGTDGLREAIAAMENVQPDQVQVVTGASEALNILFFMAAEPDADIVVPSPCFPTFTELPDALGIEARTYELRPENDFRIDVDEVKRLVDDRTKLLFVNSPHNPTGCDRQPGNVARASCVRHHKFYKRGQEVGAANLALLDKFFDVMAEVTSH